jgi:serine/threonine protein kinase
MTPTHRVFRVCNSVRACRRGSTWPAKHVRPSYYPLPVCEVAPPPHHTPPARARTRSTDSLPFSLPWSRYNFPLSLRASHFCSPFPPIPPLSLLQYQSSTISGNPAYMAPEQLTGRALSVKADIWALGVVVWEVPKVCWCWRLALSATVHVGPVSACICVCVHVRDFVHVSR